MADTFVKGEDGAESYGCKVTWISHHPPELIIKEGWSEVERISLERYQSPNELRRLMESKGFKRTAEYEEKMRNKRDIEFTAGQDADIYYIDKATGERTHVGEATPDSPLQLGTHVGHVFEAQDGFGDPIATYTVTERQRQRVHIPAETPDSEF